VLGEGKITKELFPILIKESYERDDYSLCPSFMKSRSLSFPQSNLIYSIENRQEEFNIKEQEDDKELLEIIELPKCKEQSTTHQDTIEATFSKERRNRKFTQEEDEKLRVLVKVYGEGAWSQIAEEMKGRNRKQVRERYVNFLKKEHIVPEFTTEEDVTILKYVQTHGRRWSAISEQLTSKTPIMIKNRYYTKLAKIRINNTHKGELYSAINSKVDSSTGLVSLLSSSKNGNQRFEKKGQNRSIERLKVQEKNMRTALTELRKRIERTKAKEPDPSN